MSESKASEPHSQEFLTKASRRFLWDEAYLALLVQRLGLDEARVALDVGCGAGQFTFALAKALPRVRFQGVDPEPRWLERAAQTAEELGLAGRCRFEVGRAEALPAEDGAFDLVTCQTLLMHLPRPELGLREMRRVLRVGGVLLAVEPANRASIPLVGSLERTPDELGGELAFYLTCERGKVTSLEGDNSIGDQLPGLVAREGFASVEVFQWEHTAPLVPPYATPAERAAILDLRSEQARLVWIWDRETTRRYYLAGGGVAERFEGLYAAALEAQARVLAAIEAGTYHRAGGAVVYVVSGRRAAAAQRGERPPAPGPARDAPHVD